MINLKAVAEGKLVHKFAGLEGVRCGLYIPGETQHISLSWDTVTCKNCLKRKESWEPDYEIVDTKGD